MIRIAIKKFSLVALTVAVVFCSSIPVVRAADPLSVTHNPAAAANIGTTGTGWSASTIARALLVDGSETNLTNALPANGASMLLVLTGFNFDIPAGATIAGIAVSVTRRSTSSSGAFVRDAAIELVGGFGTSSSLAAADAWPATLAAAAYGGPSALWGGSLTPDDVNAANFGLAIAAQNTDPDVAHNAHVDGATVTVYYYEADTTPPSIAAAPDLPGNEATSSAGASVLFDLPSASDEGGIVSESCSPASGSTFALGSTTVTCTATDTAGNSASELFDIGVVDTTPPVVALTGGTVTLAFGAAFVDPGATATDTVDGTDTVSAGGSVDTGAAGEYTLTYDATDAAGNRAVQQTRVVTVLPAAEVVASPAPSGGNGAPVGLYGISNSGGEVLGAETSAKGVGNIGTGAFTGAQISALLEFLRAFGVDSVPVDALGNALRNTAATSTTP